jgi:pyruvate ferredoxin oxidoreductase gamma subunit
MTEIRLHGRYGQPVGKVARAIGKYALEQGKRVQVFDAFSAYRPGAPMYTVVRVADEYIRERSANNTKPDVVMVLDNSLFGVADVTKGLKENGTVWALGVTAEVLGTKGNGYKFSGLDSLFAQGGEVEANLISALKSQGILA